MLRDNPTSSPEAVPKPQDPGRISTREEAEIRVRQIRNGFWADFRPGDRSVANAHARMAVADEAFGILGRQDLTQAEINRSTFLLIEARDKIVKTQYGHFKRAQDMWADKMSERVREHQAAVEENGISVQMPVGEM